MELEVELWCAGVRGGIWLHEEIGAWEIVPWGR